MSVTTGNSSSPPTTTRCSACSTTRGVVDAARGILKATSDASADTLTTGIAAKPTYQLLTNEQWSLINRIVQPDDAPRRGRPSADARTVVNAILYRDATGIAWREPPPTLGSWKTAARRYRQLTANGSWDEVLRLLAQSVPRELTTDDPTA
jgi:transposase